MFTFKKLTALTAASVMALGLAAAVPSTKPVQVKAESSAETNEMYRLFNPNSGEHFYTASQNERNTLVLGGWNYEGVGWIAPKHSNTPVYRLYNPNVGDHHYTVHVDERDMLVRAGWKLEGIGWYSDDAKRVPLYRAWNPGAHSGGHNYTANHYEQTHLCSNGWKDEGIGWYGVGDGYPAPANFKYTLMSQGTYGRIDIPALDYHVVLDQGNSWNGQSIIDRPNCAVAIVNGDGWNGLAIGDHRTNYSGNKLRALTDIPIGTTAYITHNGSVRTVTLRSRHYFSNYYPYSTEKGTGRSWNDIHDGDVVLFACGIYGEGFDVMYAYWV